jgi:predicted GIY-YIG superfamily endonuclease
VTAPRPAIRFDRESIRVFLPRKDTPTVYRIYDLWDRLLYVGASDQPRRRLLEHLRDGKLGDRVELEFCSTTTMMARKERQAIQAEPTLLDCGFGRRHASWRAQNRK